MDLRLQHTSINMTERETISVVDGKGSRVAVQRGRVWITQEHDTRDVLLTSGQSFTLDRDGTAIVEALADAEVAFEEAEAQAAPAFATARQGGERHLTALAVLGRRRAAPQHGATLGWHPARSAT